MKTAKETIKLTRAATEILYNAHSHRKEKVEDIAKRLIGDE